MSALDSRGDIEDQVLGAAVTLVMFERSGLLHGWSTGEGDGAWLEDLDGEPVTRRRARELLADGPRYIAEAVADIWWEGRLSAVHTKKFTGSFTLQTRHQDLLEGAPGGGGQRRQ
jgi:hypothetical protein